ncbi:hypothetical protein EJB05_04820 [Eragrostis curvula]|uniref:Uncharacterized protein n=1 Tax=Eragrostis curvula TaxID=38414 RepID=A0A5J9WBQ2_9POAL|nr:hypothetical protein EJB05_04820 [Eragrostis curvula]
MCVSPAGGLAPAATEQIAPFEDGQYVRLVNRGRGGYLFADETGRGVSVDRRRGMVNTAWAVQILRTPTAAHVLLRGAYGRYLAVTNHAPPRPGHVGFYVAQCVFEYPDDHHIEWWTAPGNRGSVLLLHGTAGGLRALRANGRYQWWKTGVTAEAVNFSRITSMMEWEVEVIPMTVERPPYQLRPPSAAIQWHEGCQEEVDITFARADNNGSFERQGWTCMTFNGRSLTQLGNEIADQMGRGGEEFKDMTLFVIGGQLGQPTPLLTDLPLRDDPVTIVVFRVGTPEGTFSILLLELGNRSAVVVAFNHILHDGHDALRFPDLAAE